MISVGNQVSGSIVLVGSAHQTIVSIHRLVKRVAGSSGDGLVGTVTPGVVCPRETFLGIDSRLLYNERSLFFYEVFSGTSWTWEADRPCASSVELATA